MKRKDINQTFHRFGSRYGHFINPDHFLGRDPFDEPWMVRKRPLINLRQGEDHYEMHLALPGFKKSELKVKLDGNNLHIIGNKDANTPEVGNEWIRREFGNESFHKIFELQADTDCERIESSFDDGVLEILLYTLKQEASAKKAIEIR